MELAITCGRCTLNVRVSARIHFILVSLAILLTNFLFAVTTTVELDVLGKADITPKKNHSHSNDS